MMHNLDLIRIVSGSTDANQLSNASRILTSVYGAITVLMTFILARLVFSGLPSFIAALLCGVTPLLGTHSQFINEDIFITPLLAGAIYALIRWALEPTYRSAILLGLLFGLSVSAKYSSFIFIFPLIYTLIATNKLGLRVLLQSLAIFITTTILVYSLVQLPAFMEIGKWVANFNAEAKHAITGQRLIF